MGLFPDGTPHGGGIGLLYRGGVAEWSIATVLKTVGAPASRGPNPLSSANTRPDARVKDSALKAAKAHTHPKERLPAKQADADKWDIDNSRGTVQSCGKARSIPWVPTAITAVGTSDPRKEQTQDPREGRIRPMPRTAKNCQWHADE